MRAALDREHGRTLPGCPWMGGGGDYQPALPAGGGRPRGPLQLRSRQRVPAGPAILHAMRSRRRRRQAAAEGLLHVAVKANGRLEQSFRHFDQARAPRARPLARTQRHPRRAAPSVPDVARPCSDSASPRARSLARALRRRLFSLSIGSLGRAHRARPGLPGMLTGPSLRAGRPLLQ